MIPSRNALEQLRKFRFHKSGNTISSLHKELSNEGSEIRKSFNELSESDKERQEENDVNGKKTENFTNRNPESKTVLSNGVTCHSISDSDSDSKSSEQSSPEVEPKKYSRIRTNIHSKNCNKNKSNKFNGAAYHPISDSDSDSKNSEKSSPKVQPKKYSRIRTFIKSKNTNKSKSVDYIQSDSSEDERSVVSTGHKRKEPPPSVKLNAKKVKTALSEDEHWSDKVYDSSDDDSDYELSDEMSKTQNRVFDFLNTATKIELLQIQTCSEKKVAAIIEGRPYKGWRDLVYKFNSGKGINTQFLNYTLDCLKSRSIVSKLMKKCLDLAITTEQAISTGSSILEEQPSILTECLKLMPYQLVGLNWLAVMHSQQLNGILADEMGLGKTIQVVAFFGYLKQNGFSPKPHLVVVPTTTMDNWAIEFTRWCPEIRLAIYHGSPEERRLLRFHWFKDKFTTMDVIITTYTIVSSTPEERKMFKIIPLKYVVFDEAHMLKNMNSQRYSHLFNINAQHKILLTGTPLQNNLLELMSLLNFVMPGMFASNIQYIKNFFSKNSKVPVSNLPDFEKEQIDLAKRIMKPFFLRRLKADVLNNLPKKTYSLIHCPLHQEQKEKYMELLSEVKVLSEARNGEYSYMTSFMQLRKLANHPLALRYIYTEDQLKEIAIRLAGDYDYKQNNKDYIFEDLIYMSDHEIHQKTLEYKCISKFKLDDSYFLKSGKFKKLDELLPKLKEEGHRVVMFSQFVFLLDIIEDYMRIRGHSFLRLDGSTKSLDRQELIDNYNEDNNIFMFLLSTRAGGVGINLTSADTVIIHDVDFNPYNDKQAEDRCHRLGQTKSVDIIRLISEGTVEEAIYAKAKSKLELEQEIIGNDDDADVELLLKEALGIKT